MAACKLCKAKNAELKVNLNRFCNYDCATSWAQIASQKAQDKARAKKASEVRRQDRQKLDRLKTRQEWLKECQVVFNRYIRMRDAGLPCISCGHPDDGSRQRHASHYRSVGSAPELRFEPVNCWASCSICNNHLSGNLIPYRAALLQKIGSEKLEWLEGPHETLKLTIEEIKELKKVYSEKCKALTGQSSI